MTTLLKLHLGMELNILGPNLPGPLSFATHMRARLSAYVKDVLSAPTTKILVILSGAQ